MIKRESLACIERPDGNRKPKSALTLIILAKIKRYLTRPYMAGTDEHLLILTFAHHLKHQSILRQQHVGEMIVDA